MSRFALVVLGCAVVAFATAQPQLHAGSAVVLDARNGRVLFELNADEPLPPASTTKILTALVVAAHTKMDETVFVPPDAVGIEGSSFHLRPAEAISVRDLLYALLLRSGNDVAHTLAVHVAGSDGAFAGLMNKEAAMLGCTSSRFMNPHGLPAPGHLTSARDLATIARTLLENPDLAEIVRSQRHQVNRGKASKDTLLVNRNVWLARDRSAVGVKTGHTQEAGECFVGAADRPQGQIVTALLGSTDWLRDQEALVAYAYGTFHEAAVASPGKELAQIRVENGASNLVPVGVASEYRAMVAEGERWTLEPRRSSVRAPVRQGDHLGIGVLRSPEGFEVKLPVVALGTVEESFLARYGSLLAGALAGAAVGLGLLARRARRAA